MIEVNTVPGMTEHSNVPKSGSLIGLSYNEVVQKLFMSPYKNKFFITFFLFSLSLNAQYEININFESGFEYQSQVILAKIFKMNYLKKEL